MGMLHSEVFRARLEEELGVESLITSPKVVYRVEFLKDKRLPSAREGEVVGEERRGEERKARAGREERKTKRCEVHGEEQREAKRRYQRPTMPCTPFSLRLALLVADKDARTTATRLARRCRFIVAEVEDLGQWPEGQKIKVRVSEVTPLLPTSPT